MLDRAHRPAGKEVRPADRPSAPAPLTAFASGGGNAAMAALVTGASGAQLARQRRPRRPAAQAPVRLLDYLQVSAPAGYHRQTGPRCSAGSYVAAVSIRDTESGDPRHGVAAAAVESVRRYVTAHRREIVEGHLLPTAERGSGEVDPARLQAAAEAGFERLVIASLDRARAALPADPRAAYGLLEDALLNAFRGADEAIDERAGPEIVAALGLPLAGAGAQATHDILMDFGDLADNAVVNALQPGDAARITWWVERGGGQLPRSHVFLIGRHARDRSWFVYDQGSGFRMVSGSREGLTAGLDAYVASGGFRLARRPPPPRTQDERLIGVTGRASLVPAPRRP